MNLIYDIGVSPTSPFMFIGRMPMPPMYIIHA